MRPGVFSLGPGALTERYASLLKAPSISMDTFAYCTPMPVRYLALRSLTFLVPNKFFTVPPVLPSTSNAATAVSASAKVRREETNNCTGTNQISILGEVSRPPTALHPLDSLSFPCSLHICNRSHSQGAAMVVVSPVDRLRLEPFGEVRTMRISEQYPMAAATAVRSGCFYRQVAPMDSRIQSATILPTVIDDIAPGLYRSNTVENERTSTMITHR